MPRVAFTALALAAVASALPLRFAARERALLASRAEAAALHAASGGSVPPDQFFDLAIVDHLALAPPADGAGTWRQRFWTNDTFWQAGGRKGPVFLYLEGEATGSPYSVLSGQHVELAAVHGALIISLEHRFYGASQPSRDWTPASLARLSSHQAVGDVARFLRAHVGPTYNVTFPATKVVTFGGSYPGALSAWVRLRLPHLVTAAVSTSSPVLASFDFAAYNAVVGRSLAQPLVGGSPACAASVAAAFAALDAALRAGGAAAGAAGRALNSCQDLAAAPPLDVMWAASNYGGFVQGLVQYNEESGLDVRGLCGFMANASATPLENFARAARAGTGPACVDNSYSDYVLAAGNTTADPAARGLGLRQWMWQSCSQFSYWQTCEGDCPLSAFMTLESNTRQCADLFGAPFSAAAAADRVAVTNDLLGGAEIAATNVVYVNGLIDPWHALSVLESRGGARAVVVDDTAHCRTMAPARAGDEPALVAARKEIADQIAAWLK